MHPVLAFSYFGLINYPVHAITFVPVASRTAKIQVKKSPKRGLSIPKNRCRSTLATVFSFYIIGSISAHRADHDICEIKRLFC